MMRRTSSRVRPNDGTTWMPVSTPVRVSFAVTCSTPSASIRKVTAMRGRPAGAGGIPVSLNAPSWRQSVDLLALALVDVDVDAGLVVDLSRELLGVARWDGRVAQDQLADHAAHGLDAERQRDDVEQQHRLLLPPCRMSAWTAAPSATAWSGSMLVWAPCRSAAPACVAPAAPASSRRPAPRRRSGRRSGRRRRRRAGSNREGLLDQRSRSASSNSARDTVSWLVLAVAADQRSPGWPLPRSDSWTLEALGRAADRLHDVGVELASPSWRGCRCTPRILSISSRSKSSPPRWVLPAVASTRNTQSWMFRIDTSKVPPPRS